MSLIIIFLVLPGATREIVSCCLVTYMEKLLFKPTGGSYILDTVRYKGSTGKCGVFTGVKNSRLNIFCNFFLLYHVLKLTLFGDPVDRSIYNLIGNEKSK